MVRCTSEKSTGCRMEESQERVGAVGEGGDIAGSCLWFSKQ